MANVSGVSSSSFSSIYGARGANIVSGLVSGLDTESMIENSVKGYQLKIQNLKNQQTKLLWKQDAYRSITDKLIALSEKYTSYASKTNLSSNSFFTNAVKTTTNGTNAGKVSATGKTNSDIKINSVEQLASAAKYQVSVNDLNFNVDSSKAVGNTAIDTKSRDVSDISGTLTLKLGGTSVDLTFSETDVVKDAAGLASMIKDKLVEAVREKGSITFEGNTYSADEIDKNISVTADGSGKIVFQKENIGGAAISIAGVSGDLADSDGPVKVEQAISGSNVGSITVVDSSKLSHIETAAERLSGKTVDITLDGETAKITLGDYVKSGLSEQALIDQVQKDLQKGLEDNFGNKVTVSADGGKLSFNLTDTESTSSLKVTSTAGETLGIGAAGVTNYLNTGKKLKDILETEEFTDGDKTYTILKGMTALGAVGEVKKENGKYTDSAGNSVARIGGTDDDPVYAQLDKDGNVLYGMEINGKKVGRFTVNSALDSVFSSINNSDAGVKVTYSQLSNKLTFTSTKTGSQSRIDFEDGLSQKLFGGNEMNVAENGLLLDDNGKEVSGIDDQGKTYYVRKIGDNFVRAREDGRPELSGGSFITVDPSDPAIQKARKGYSAGQDAIVNISVNGEQKQLVRSSNVIDMDGMTVTVKGTFNEGYDKDNGTVYGRDDQGNIDKSKKVAMAADSQVSFTSSADSDTVVDAVKSFVEEINAIMKEVREGYSTLPLSTTTGKSYEPLSDEEKADLSETQIEAYEKEAKTGILFGDRNMSRLYSELRSAISSSGLDVAELRDIGLTTTYSDGITTLSLDEDKLRSALDSDPDKVRNAFAKTMENGFSSDGLMANIKKISERYASTSIGNYGVLVREAGTRTKSHTLNDNYLQKLINNYNKQIESWQTKMSDKVDYYTTQFTKLEQLMNEMNSQSSALAGLMGGGSY